METKLIKIIRWTLRVLSGLFIVFFLFMFIGETFFKPESGNAEPMSINSIIQLLLMGISMTGLGLAWKWELTGGIIALAAFIVLGIVNPSIWQFSLLYIYPATAILFIVIWAISKNAKVMNE